MKSWNIWTLENENLCLILKAIPNPDRFWIELYRKFDQKVLERTKMVVGWEQVTGLLEKYQWTKFETVSVEPSFTKLVSELRKETNTYKKPSSRERILELYDRFRNNENIDIHSISTEFGIGIEEVKRDIKIIREFLIRESKGIVYDRGEKVYKIKDAYEEEFKEVI
jgi:hypothetical protein